MPGVGPGRQWVSRGLAPRGGDRKNPHREGGPRRRPPSARCQMGVESAAPGGEGSSCLTEGDRPCLPSREAQGAQLVDLWATGETVPQVRQLPRSGSPKSRWGLCVLSGAGACSAPPGPVRVEGRGPSNYDVLLSFSAA